MQCPQCQHDNREQAKFCEGCGTRLVAKCAECGTELGPGARFCSECGTPVAGPPPAAPPPASQPTSRFTSPQAYTPQHLAERIISSRGALEGERKQVTVLFADLKGSMELLADRDPEDARRILDPVLERMMEAVHRYEGTVNQVMGDGIMALFGAPLAHEDHAVRACYAALRMQEAVKDYADEVRRAEGITPQIRVGLNSGEVVVRSVGSDLRMDYTAVGQTTHLAARMEQLATPGSILLACATLQLAEGYMQVQTLGPMAVKGLSEPVEVYELVGAGTARTRLAAAAARGLTKFVGRDAELDTLRRTLEQAGSGHGQIVALVGEPGVGKSRLVWEFTHSHRAHGWLVLEADSVSYGKATSYLPVIDLLKSYCGIEDRDDARRIREKLTGKLLTLDRALEPTLPALLALLDVPADDPTWHALDPPQRRQRMLDACKRLLLRESQEQPLLLVFEDLHWIDAETQALLDSLVESLPTARILLLVNYRPEYEHAWHRKTYYQQLRLDPLPLESAQDLLTALLGDALSLGPLKRLLVERTEGNPFFLEESVQSLVETGGLVGERGAYRLAQPLGTTQVPATVQAVLAARIDRLAPEDKRLLQAASVIGKDVPYPLLQAIAELSEDALQQGLTRLQAAEFLYETSLFPDLEYTFKHALTYEVAYGSLLHERRRAMHTRIMEAIETLYPARQAEQIERLAHHAVQGEGWDRAVGYLRQAGRKAEAHSAYREAVTYVEQALAALQHLPDSRETRELAIDLRTDMRGALGPLGESGRLLAYLREAEPLAAALDDQRRLGVIAGSMAICFFNLGDLVSAVQYGGHTLVIATALGDRALELVARVRLGVAYYSLGNYREARDVLGRNLELLDGDLVRARFGSMITSVISAARLALCLAELGEFAEAAARADEALAIAEVEEHPLTSATAYWLLSDLYLIQGDPGKAIGLIERGRAVNQASRLQAVSALGMSRVGRAYALAGRSIEGVPMLEQAVQVATGSTFVQGGIASYLFWLAEAYLLAGRADDAAHTALRGLASAQEHKERGVEVYALRLLGEIATQADPPNADQAESYYQQALALAEELGMRPLVAHCHLGLGTLYQRVGRDDEAQARVATAIEMYRAMDMAFWLARAETMLAQVAN
jgi:class 3 adenylate cyclase/tetratricopeptide (TPR) repeat protein